MSLASCHDELEVARMLQVVPPTYNAGPYCRKRFSDLAEHTFWFCGMDFVYFVGCMLLKLCEAKKRRDSLRLIRAFQFCLIKK